MNVPKDLHACVCGSDIKCKVVDKYWPKDVEGRTWIRVVDVSGREGGCVGMERG